MPLPPLDTQRNFLEKVTAQRKALSELKAEADQKTQQIKADVEAMILGTKPVPVKPEAKYLHFI